MPGRSGELGLTLIELLLSLVILALLTGFVAGGLSIGRRAFDADQVSANDAKTDAAIQSILNLVASALPYPDDNQQAAVLFDGGAERIRFIALSEGRALRGGPYQVDLRRVGNELVVEIGGRPGLQKQAERPVWAVVVLRGVHAVHFEYFGAAARGASGQDGWQKDWRAAPELPRLISLRIDFEDRRRNGPASIVALRQG